jgi:ubiquinone/menaquinone biosynthesis C-methylase UbiE
MAGEWNVDMSETAQNYERYLVPRIFRPSAQRLLDIVEPKPGDSVLDVACGTGIVARLAADRVGDEGHVVGVDMVPGMLEVARANDSRVEWREARASELPLPDDTFDVVTCQQGLQFFPDKPAALREMHRVSAPGAQLGIAVLAEISRTPLLDALAGAFEEHTGPGPAQFVRMIGSLGDESQLHALVAGADYTDVEVQTVIVEISPGPVPDFIRQYLTSTPLAALPAISQADEAVIRKVEEDVAAALPGLGAGVSPATTHVVTARAA